MKYTIIETSVFNDLHDDPREDDSVQIALGDWGAARWMDKHLTKINQPVALHASEVLIEVLWDYATNIWNLGAVIFEVFRNVSLFTGEPHTSTQGSVYEVREHLRQIIDVCGPFP